LNENPKNNPKPNPSSKSSEGRSTSPYMKYSGMAFQLIAGTILGYWLGTKVDGWLDMKSPVFTIGLAMLFTIGTLVKVIRDLMKE